MDLHGLHATKAVMALMALQERLAHLEKELATNPASIYNLPERALDDAKVLNEQPLPLAASRAVVKNELSIITGNEYSRMLMTVHIMVLRYSSLSMDEIHKFSSSYSKLLDKAGEAKIIPDNLALEVSSLGVDFEQFKDLPMYVRYIESLGDSGADRRWMVYWGWSQSTLRVDLQNGRSRIFV